MSPSRLPIERLAGVLLLLIIPVMIAGIVFDPGLDSRSEYFAESFARFVPQREQALVGTTLLFAVGLIALAAAGTLYLAFRSYRSGLVTLSAAGLLAAGMLFVAGAAAGLRLYRLATNWAALAGAAADRVANSALAAQQLRVGLLFLGLPLLLVSLLAWGVVIHRRSTLPRWLLGLPALGGAIVVLSPLGFLDVLNTGFGGFLMIGGLVLFIWLVVEAGWLVARGGRPGLSRPA